MSAHYARPETASPRSLHPSRADLREERAADRAECMLETLDPQARMRDEMIALFEEIDGIRGVIAGRCSEFGYDPGRDRIDAGRRASLFLSAAKAAVRNALDEMEDAQ